MTSPSPSVSVFHSRESPFVLRMSRLLLLAFIFLLPLPGHAQVLYNDLGHALYAAGYSGSVWVNSFDPHQSYLAHGVFNPDVPLSTAGYEAREWNDDHGVRDADDRCERLLRRHGHRAQSQPDHLGRLGLDRSAERRQPGGQREDPLRLWTARATAPGRRSSRPGGRCNHNWTVRVYRHVEGSGAAAS